MQKTQNSQNNLEKVGAVRLPELKAYSKATVSRATNLCSKDTRIDSIDRWNRIESLEINSHSSSNNFQQGCQAHAMGKE